MLAVKYVQKHFLLTLLNTILSGVALVLAGSPM